MKPTSVSLENGCDVSPDNARVARNAADRPPLNEATATYLAPTTLVQVPVSFRESGPRGKGVGRPPTVPSIKHLTRAGGRVVFRVLTAIQGKQQRRIVETEDEAKRGSQT